MSLTKQEVIDAVQSRAEDAGVELTKKATGEILDSVFDLMSKEVATTGRFAYPGFGTFKRGHRKERQGRNPQTGEPMTIAARNVVKFKPAPTFKDLVNE